VELVHWSIPAADNRLHWYAKTPERSLVALTGKPNRRGFDLPGATRAGEPSTRSPCYARPRRPPYGPSAGAATVNSVTSNGVLLQFEDVATPPG
jgi:hypothetical protein